MLRTARERVGGLGFTVAQTDARWLPFRDDTFDRVIANHMLYHVPDRSAAFSEIKRVLRPGGKLFASTNSETSMSALFDLVEDIQLGTYRPRTTDNFSLESGSEQMQPYFNSMKIAYFEDALHITEAQPVIDYVGSTGRLNEQNLAVVGERTQSILDEHGVWVVDKLGGLFICEV